MDQQEQLCQAGDVIGRRYQIQAWVGRGNFAEVYRAQDLVLERPVAIKVLSPRARPGDGPVDEQTVTADTIQRFYREAKLVAALRDQHTVTMFDFGNTEEGYLYMAMEFIDGTNIKEAIKQQGPFDAERTTKILIQALKSLREAHTFGLLHRDIKPENLLLFDYLMDKDQVRVLDFGIAKALEDEKSKLTAAGVLVGTPRYVPPERVESSEVVPASDIFSLGVVAYEMLTATNLYPGMGMMQVIRAQISPDPITLPLKPEVPMELRRIVEKMMAKKLEDRYSAAQQVIEELEQFQLSIDIARFSDKSLDESLDAAKTTVIDAIDVIQKRPTGQNLRTHNPQMQTIPPTGQAFPNNPPEPEAPMSQRDKLLIIGGAIVAAAILLSAVIVVVVVLINRS